MGGYHGEGRAARGGSGGAVGRGRWQRAEGDGSAVPATLCAHAHSTRTLPPNFRHTKSTRFFIFESQPLNDRNILIPFPQGVRSVYRSH